MQESPAVSTIVSANDVLLTYDGVAAVLSVSKMSVMRWVRDGMVPPPTRIGANTRFTQDWVTLVKKDGLRAAGTYPVTPGIRSEVGKKGNEVRAANARKLAAKVRRGQGKGSKEATPSPAKPRAKKAAAKPEQGGQA